MDESSKITLLPGGKYSVKIGRENYIFSTKLDEQSLKRIINNLSSLVEEMPRNFSQNQILFLTLMQMAHQVDCLNTRLKEFSAKCHLQA